MANQIDFSQYEKDLQEQACGRTLTVFRSSPVLRSVQWALVGQAQELYDQQIRVLDLRQLEKAAGAQLDVIGRIVGQSRILINQSAIDWFTPDYEFGAPDSSPVWASPAQTGGDEPATDAQYLILLRAKIFKNHVQYGSIPEIINFAKLVYGIDISVVKLGNSDLQIVVPDTAPRLVIETLISSRADERADSQYFLPIPTTGRITSVMVRPAGVPFAPDRISGSPDTGRASIGYGIDT